MYTFDQSVLARNHEQKTVDLWSICFGSKSWTKNSRLFVSSSFAQFVQWHPIDANTYIPSTLSVLLQLKDLINENMKISK